MRQNLKSSSRCSIIRSAPIIKLLLEVDMPKDVVSLGQGVPFFAPPTEVVSAIQQASAQPEGYRYTKDVGRDEVLEAVAEKIKQENKIIANPHRNIMMTAGGNQAFLNALLSITDLGDEIIVISPTYFNHVMAIKLAGCQPILLETRPEEGYLPDIDQIKNAISPRTKALVSISPNNPTGAVYPQKLLKSINDLCAEHSLYHISDEVYEYFVFDGAKHVSPGSFDSTLCHTISLFSFSKAFSMSGYRIGYMVYPEHLFEDILKVQDTIGICAPAPSQAGACIALGMGKSYVEKYLDVMRNTRRIFAETLENLENVFFSKTNGSYYFFVGLKTTKPARTICKKLISEYEVVTLPGDIFDCSTPSIRLSYGNVSEETAVEGMSRLQKGLEALL